MRSNSATTLANRLGCGSSRLRDPVPPRRSGEDHSRRRSCRRLAVRLASAYPIGWMMVRFRHCSTFRPLPPFRTRRRAAEAEMSRHSASQKTGRTLLRRLSPSSRHLFSHGRPFSLSAKQVQPPGSSSMKQRSDVSPRSRKSSPSRITPTHPYRRSAVASASLQQFPILADPPHASPM